MLEKLGNIYQSGKNPDNTKDQQINLFVGVVQDAYTISKTKDPHEMETMMYTAITAVGHFHSKLGFDTVSILENFLEGKEEALEIYAALENTNPNIRKAARHKAIHFVRNRAKLFLEMGLVQLSDINIDTKEWENSEPITGELLDHVGYDLDTQGNITQTTFLGSENILPMKNTIVCHISLDDSQTASQIEIIRTALTQEIALQENI